MSAHLTSLGPQGGVAFHVNPASSQDNLVQAGVRQVVMGTERFDVGSNFASNVFTAPVTGHYQLNFMIRVNALDSGATYYQTYLLTSNKTYYTTIAPGSLSGDASYWSLATISVLADLDVNDTAYCAVYQLGGSNQTDIETETYYSGYLVA